MNFQYVISELDFKYNNTLKLSGTISCLSNI